MYIVQKGSIYLNFIKKVYKIIEFIKRMKRLEIMNYLEKVFNYKTFTEPYSSNGLQVEGNENVQKIAFAVDATLETMQKAIDNNCQMLIVHHGIFWPSIKSVTGPNKRKIKLILDNGLSLVGMHLPLDRHEKIGNNIEMIKLLGANKVKNEDEGFMIGEFENVKKITEIVNILDKELDTISKFFDFSNGKVKRFAVCTGAGTGILNQVIKSNCDLFITGELRYEAHENAKENGISLIASGHYATETLGVKALMAKMQEELDIESVFIDGKIDL